MTRVILIILSVSLFGSYTAAQTQQKERKSHHSFWFDWNQSVLNEEDQSSQWNHILTLLQEEPQTEVDIVGWADKVGPLRANENMSLRRAEAVRDYLLANGIRSNRITVRGCGVDWQATEDAKARRVDLIITKIKEVAPLQADQPQKNTTPEAEKVQEHKPSSVQEHSKAEENSTSEQEIVTVDQEIAAPVNEAPLQKVNQRYHQFSLRTNLLYWVGGIFNVGVEWNPIPMVGIVLNGGYAPWESEQWRLNWGGWFVSPEVRIYLGQPKRWFVGGQFLIGEYNLKPGDLGRQGSVITGGVMGGYKLSISPVFDLDFTLGVGYGELKYKGYHTENGVKKYVGNGLQRGIMPIQAGVSFIWKIR